MSDKPKMSSGREGPSGSRGRARQNVSSDRRAAAAVEGMDITESYNLADAAAATAGGTELTSNQMMAKMTQMNMQANANAVVMAEKDKDTGLALQDGSRVKKVVG